MRISKGFIPCLTIMIAVLICGFAFAQEPARQASPPPQARPRTPNDTLVSPEVLPDKQVTFRLYAPDARTVKVNGEWFNSPEEQKNATHDLEAGSNGVWSVTIGPLMPGTFRYRFIVDGVQVTDPRNPNSSGSFYYVYSVFSVPGLDYQDIHDVPHGAVASVWYQSKALGILRRMHIYTPPGYEEGKGKYPVFYLLHGAGDADDVWTTEGRAAVNIDNLIAAKQAKPMIVVMPAGHTPSQVPGGAPGGMRSRDFEKDFWQDIMPYVESHYRVRLDRNSRAIAGLSMGGMQTLHISMAHLDKFAYIGVVSSGWIRQTPEAIEKEYGTELSDVRAQKGLRVFWFATGKGDGLIPSTRTSVEILKKHGFNVELEESNGMHTWINWRDYLHQFAPRLFQ